MKRLSVIVPIFNSEKYLNRCINSILEQTYNNIELILINDGSTDSTDTILEKYSNNPDIKIIHKENGGQSSARNMGIDISTGDYITFVDSDDWIEKNIYEYCIPLLEEYQSDIVTFKTVFTRTDKLNNVSNSSEIDYVKKENLLEDYLHKGQTEKAPFSVGNKIYKRYLFENIRFKEGMVNEDIILNFEVLKKANSLVHSNKIGYFYFLSSNSTTRNGFESKDYDLLKACKLLEEMSRDENDKVKYLVKVKEARSYFSLLAKIAFYGFNDDKLDEKKVTKELTSKLRGSYNLLMKSPMPINRKMMVSVLCINVNLLRIPLKVYKRIKGV